MQWSAIAGTWRTAGATAWQVPEDLWEESDGHGGRLWTRSPQLGALPPAQARLLADAVGTGVVATDIDQDSTYVGADRATVDSLLCHPALEVVEVRRDQPIGRDSDTINRPAPPWTPRRRLFRGR
ncbi:hypothetical protein [Actinoplanes sp. NPDC049681]|uniref:hypothetical protein n=1 Tax=Actinoplanes sp. NPDC049681 TaxID=3363905 RepID=UPI0037AC8D23